MDLLSHIIRRLMLIIPMMIGITLLLFIVTHIVPSDPLAAILPEKSLESPEIVATTRAKWGLDKPLYVQYLVYLNNLVHGDMGTSFKTKNAVTTDLTQFLPATIELSIASFIFAVVLGLPLGVISALKSGKLIDHFTRIFSLFGASMPPFWSGLIVLFLFYYLIPIFPGPGRIDARLTAPPTVTGLFLIDSLVIGDWTAFWSSVTHLILPSIILGWFELALIARITRSSLLEIMSQDYIRTARSKGLKEGVVVIRHGLRNAMIPLVTILGLAFAGLMTGAITTETIFAWPGVGRYAVLAATNLDYPAIMGVTLVIALLYMLINLLVDVTYAVIDPRIREM